MIFLEGESHPESAIHPGKKCRAMNSETHEDSWEGADRNSRKFYSIYWNANSIPLALEKIKSRSNGAVSRIEGEAILHGK